MRKRLLFLLLLTAAVAGGGVIWQQTRQRTTDGPLVLSGNVEVRQVALGFKVAGRIDRLAVEEGDRVAAGQELARLEPVYFQDDLAQAQAQREQAAATLAKMEKGFRSEEIAQARANLAEREATMANATIARQRTESLLASGAGTRRDYDDSAAAEREARARLAQTRQALALQESGNRVEDIALARAQLAEKDALRQQSERRLADSRLLAPSPGIVLSRSREVGAIVNAGETTYVLSLISPVWVRSYVSETELGRLHPGQEVTIATDTPGFPLFKGRIGFLSPTAEFTPKAVETRELRSALVYRFRITVEDPDNRLRQGQPVTITVSGP